MYMLAHSHKNIASCTSSGSEITQKSLPTQLRCSMEHYTSIRSAKPLQTSFTREKTRKAVVYVLFFLYFRLRFQINSLIGNDYRYDFQYRRYCIGFGNLSMHRNVSPHCHQSRVLFRHTLLVGFCKHRHCCHRSFPFYRKHLCICHFGSICILLFLVDTGVVRAKEACREGVVS